MKKLVLVVTLISALALTACGNSATNGNVTNTVASNSITDAVTDAAEDVAEDIKEIVEEAESTATEETEVTDTTDEVTESEIEEEPMVHECKNAEPLSPDAVVDFSATYIDGTRYEVDNSIGWIYLNDEQMFDFEDLVIGSKDNGDTCILSEVLKESELDKNKFIKNEYGFYEYSPEGTRYKLKYENGVLSYLTVSGLGENMINNAKYMHLNDLVEEFGKPYILKYESFDYTDAEYFSPEYGESDKNYAYAFRLGDYIVSYRAQYVSSNLSEIDLFGCTIFNINAYDNIDDIVRKM